MKGRMQRPARFPTATFETDRRRHHAAARTAGNRGAGAAAAGRRGRTRPDGPRRHDDRPEGSQPIPHRGRTRPHWPGLAKKFSRLRAVRTNPGERGRRGPRGRRGGARGHPRRSRFSLSAQPAAVVRCERRRCIRHDHGVCGAAGLGGARGRSRGRRGPAPPPDDLGPRGRWTRRGARSAHHRPRSARLGAVPHGPADRRRGRTPGTRCLREAGRRAPGGGPHRAQGPAPDLHPGYYVLPVPDQGSGAGPGRSRGP